MLSYAYVMRDDDMIRRIDVVSVRGCSFLRRYFHELVNGSNQHWELSDQKAPHSAHSELSQKSLLLLSKKTEYPILIEDRTSATQKGFLTSKKCQIGSLAHSVYRIEPKFGASLH